METALFIALIIAALTFTAKLGIQAYGQIKTIRSETNRTDALTRMADEIGRKIASDDTSNRPGEKSCTNPFCPIHGQQ